MREHGIPNALLTGRNRDRARCAGGEASLLLPQRGRGGELVVPAGEHLQVDAVLVVILGPGGAVAETPSLKLIGNWDYRKPLGRAPCRPMSFHRKRIHRWSGSVPLLHMRVLRERAVWWPRSSLREVTTTEQLLEQALGQVAAATQATLELAENDGTGQLIFTARQCLDVQNLLEDAGAVFEVDPADTRTPHELLRLAAAALDGIPADERPALLAPARAELQATMAALADTGRA